MTHGELFAGIGGFGLAGRWCGIESVFQVEIDSFCQNVLKKNFPNAQLFRDIREFDGRQFAGTIDIISGGFPCQPFSHAGKRQGTDDERHLWPEMLRIIREIQPRWVVGENVRGFVDWSGGLVFEQVLSDLEASGYESQAFVLPAASVNAPHKRERCWIIAHASKVGRPLCVEVGKYKESVSERQPKNGNLPFNTFGNIRETNSERIGEANGLSKELDRIRALGNAIVPQVAYEIFRTILDYENQETP